MREKPSFDKNSQTKDNNSLWFMELLVVAGSGYIFLSSLTRIINGRGEYLDGIICLGTLIFLVIAVILAGRNKMNEKQSLHEAQQEWKRTCKLEYVAIVDRHHSDGGSYFDDYGDYHSNRPYQHLDLETTADQKAVNPRLTVLTVNVYRDIYTKLKDRNTVCIYYKPESPFTFLLEEEFE